jgi:hypothetical protein
MIILRKEDIQRGLEQLDQKAKRDGLVVDISVYGGAALILAFDLQRATRDVDVVIKGDVSLVRKLAAEVAEENHWPESWLNDGVKGFVSANEDMQQLGLDAGNKGGVRIYTPSAKYLFAMKCMAMRSEEGAHDRGDISFLAREAGIKDTDTALDLVASFYPTTRIPAKVAFGVQEIMERLEAEQKALLESATVERTYQATKQNGSVAKRADRSGRRRRN